MKTSSQLSIHTILKVVGLTAYYAVVHKYFETVSEVMQYKLVTFNILTPLAKFFTFNKLETKHDRKAFALSVAIDLVVSVIYFKILYVKFVGALFILTPPLIIAQSVLMEMVQQKILYPDKPYQLKVSPNMVDNLFPIVAAIPYAFTSQRVDYGKPLDEWTFPVFMALILIYDFLFGVAHFLLHSVPWLHKRHMLHHTYKKEELCAAASICSDLLDGILMILGYAVDVFFIGWLGRHHVAILDESHALGCTHMRYREQHMNLILFFEYDVIDMLFGAERISCFHAEHHNDVASRISLFGFYSDGFLQSLFPNLKVIGANENKKEA